MGKEGGKGGGGGKERGGKERGGKERGGEGKGEREREGKLRYTNPNLLPAPLVLIII